MGDVNYLSHSSVNTKDLKLIRLELPYYMTMKRNFVSDCHPLHSLSRESLLALLLILRSLNSALLFLVQKYPTLCPNEQKLEMAMCKLDLQIKDPH